MNKKTFVANWKMQFSFHQATDFVKTNIERLNTLSQLPEKEVIVCPSFTDLYAVTLLAHDTTIQIGAQNVSAFAEGAYTGQVSATSLAEIGCTYCIVGHSEARRFLHETSEEVARKCTELFAQGITPIICIDEETFETQLSLLYALLAQTDGDQEYIIAFEPLGAIGTGNVPSLEHLKAMFMRLYALCKAHSNPFRLLYGGSVHPDNAAQLLGIEHVDGLLIGGASLKIETFEAIVQNKTTGIDSKNSSIYD